MKVGAKYKICRRVGDTVFGKCQTQKFQVSRAKKQKTGPRRRRMRSEYGLQLNEKQKVRFSYYVTERQLANYVASAQKSRRGTAMENLYQNLEHRLDNVVYRAGFAPTRAAARQMVTHGHFTVNGRKADIPSYAISEGDVIAVREGSKKLKLFERVREALDEARTSNWIALDPKALSVKVTGRPNFDEREELTLDFAAVIEYYSRV